VFYGGGRIYTGPSSAPDADRGQERAMNRRTTNRKGKAWATKVLGKRGGRIKNGSKRLRGSWGLDGLQYYRPAVVGNRSEYREREKQRRKEKRKLYTREYRKRKKVEEEIA